MNELIERIDMAESHCDDYLREVMANCKAEINRLLLANETLKELNVEYLKRVKALEAKPVGEPVAWMYSVGDRKEVSFQEFSQDELVDGCFVTPLYTTPPNIEALIAEIDEWGNRVGGKPDIKEIVDKWRTK